MQENFKKSSEILENLRNLYFYSQFGYSSCSAIDSLSERVVIFENYRNWNDQIVFPPFWRVIFFGRIAARWRQ